MSTTPLVVAPSVSWAQRSDLLYVTIEVECKDIQYNVTETSMTFHGKDVTDSNKEYDLQLNFLKNVDPGRVTSKNIGRCMEFTIYKKESGPYWSSLTNDKTKLHFLKANFNKWKDEFEDEEEDAGADLQEWPKFMKKTDDVFKNFDDLDEDDWDDNIPSLSQNDDGYGDEKSDDSTEKSPEDVNK